MEERSAPQEGMRFLAEGAERAEAVLAHPFGLALALGDGVDDALVEAGPGPEDGLVGEMVAVRVLGYLKH